METERPLCLRCADLDHLVFLERGDAALTRRAGRYSTLRAVVVRFSRSRKRYERQGVLVEEQALVRAEQECLSDAEARRPARERAAERRQAHDAEYLATFAWSQLGDGDAADHVCCLGGASRVSARYNPPGIRDDGNRIDRFSHLGIADALKAQGLLEQDAQFTSVDQMLDGLERTSSRLAATIDAPPLDVAGLRKEWEAVRNEARRLQPANLPSRETIGHVWAQLKTESARQDRSIFETSSMMAVSAARAIPDGVRWLSASARVGATRTGHMFAAALLDQYRQTLSEIQQVGYAAYAVRQFRPYVRAAVDQFSPKRRTLTQSLFEKLRSIRPAGGE